MPPSWPSVAASLLLCWSSGVRGDVNVADSETYTDLRRDGYSWRVTQQDFSCGMVWFNQSAHARSSYRITQISHHHSCAAESKVYAQLVHVPEGAALRDLFTTVCHGADADLSLAQHVGYVDTHAGGDDDDVMAASDTVFLLVRNGCGTSIFITVEHGVDLVVTVPLPVVTHGAQVIAVLAAALVTLALLKAWARLRRCWRGAAWPPRRKVILHSSPQQDLAAALRSGGGADGALTRPLLAPGAPDVSAVV